MILFLHTRYRTTGGEERAVEDLMWLVRERLGEDVELLERSSAVLGRARAAAGMLRGGLEPDDVAQAVRRTGARVVHAHNVNPTLGWRALAAARAAGARVVLHLHQYRLVCAVGVCFTHGADCTRCHARNTSPGVRLGCRGTGVEAVIYGTGLALWQRRLAAHVDAFVVPSRAAHARLLQMGAPVQGSPVHVLPHVIRSFASASSPPADGPAVLATRLAPEKGVDLAIDACRSAGVPLVIAGDGPERAALQARAAGAEVTFTGRLDADGLARLRATAGVALLPSAGTRDVRPRRRRSDGRRSTRRRDRGRRTAGAAAGRLAGGLRRHGGARGDHRPAAWRCARRDSGQSSGCARLPPPRLSRRRWRRSTTPYDRLTT